MIIREFLPQYDNGNDNGLNHSIDLNSSSMPNPEQQLAIMNIAVPTMLSTLESCKIV